MSHGTITNPAVRISKRFLHSLPARCFGYAARITLTLVDVTKHCADRTGLQPVSLEAAAGQTTVLLARHLGWMGDWPSWLASLTCIMATCGATQTNSPEASASGWR